MMVAMAISEPPGEQGGDKHSAAGGEEAAVERLAGVFTSQLKEALKNGM